MARPGSDLPSRIVDAARERFLLEGVDGSSLRKIAKDAGTSIGMIYYHFKTKDDLFFAVVEDVYGALVRDLSRALGDPTHTPEQRLSALYARFAAMDDREFAVVRLILREGLISSKRVQRLAARFERGHLPLAMQLATDGLARGAFRADLHPLALVVSTFALAIVPQLAHRVVSRAEIPLGRQLPSATEAAEMFCEVLQRGIAKRKRSS